MLYNLPKVEDPKQASMSFIRIIIFFHATFLIGVIQFITNTNFLRTAFGEGHSKFYWLPIVFVIILLSNLIFNKKWRNKIVENNKATRGEILTFRNVLIIIILTLVPLMLGIMMTNSVV